MRTPFPLLLPAAALAVVCLTGCTDTQDAAPPATPRATSASWFTWSSPQSEDEPLVTTETICARVHYFDSKLPYEYSLIRPELEQYQEISTHSSMSHIDPEVAKYVDQAANLAIVESDSPPSMLQSSITIARIQCENLGY